ncbi:MAG: MFS transporter [Chloroflexi bacterium]|nr:MFS transporter [Chloroflexota bacterium]
MTTAAPVAPQVPNTKNNRAFVLGSLSVGHGLSHMFDQGFPLLITEIAAAMGLGTVRTATLFAVRQGGSSATSLGGGPFIDRLKSYWGIILTACMLGHAITFAAIGGSPTFALLVVVVFFMSMPGSLWHLPSAAAISQRFPDRRGFAISMHGFGSNLGNVSGPIIAGALLGASFIIWRHVFFIYAGLAVFMAFFVWWSLRGLGREDDGIRVRSLGEQFVSAGALLKNPVVMALIFAALLRGIGLNALFNWTPFYLRETLGMSTLEAGVYYALLTGMGIISAPVLGWMSDKFGRKAVLAPGFVAAALLSLAVVSVGSSLLLIPIMAGLGLFSFALHQIIQASVLDYVGQGTEATAIGLLFGINGVIGIGSPFLASFIIDYWGSYGTVYYYAGILTLITAFIIFVIPLRNPNAVERVTA